jgi:GAF domain-containing protein
VSARSAGRPATGLESVLGAIARTAAHLCEATDAAIHLLEGDCHRLVAVHGRWLARGQRLGATYAMRSDTPIDRAVLERRPVHVRDLRAVARTRFPGLVQLGLYNDRVRTILVLPLLRDGAALGGIIIRRTRVRPFTRKQIALLETFADQAAVAIENARLSQDLEARNRELSEALEQQRATAEILGVISRSQTALQPVLDAVAENAARVCGATDGTIRLVDGGAQKLAAHFGPAAHTADSLPLDRGSSSGRAIVERQPVHIHDVLAVDAAEFPISRSLQALSGDRTILAVPLLREGEAIGAILIRRQQVRPFTDREIALLQTFADQAVIAIENVRLFTEVQARNRALTEALEQQTATSEILRAISSSPTDVRPILDTITERAARLCHALFSSVYRFDGQQIDMVAQYNYPAPALEVSRRFFPTPPTRGLFTGRAILERAVVSVPDIALDAEYVAPRDLLHDAGFRSVLSVPMLRDGEPVGAITVWGAGVSAFSDREVALLQTFADQAVIAIENVRLFTELQSRNRALTEALEQQTATSEILKVISSSPTDTQPVFEAIIRNAVRLCGALHGGVWRYDGDIADIAAHYNISADELQNYRRFFPRPIREDPAHQATHSGRTLEIPDVEQFEGLLPDTRERWRARGVRSALLVPMRREAEIIGSIGVTHREVGAFSPGRVELLKTFADQAVIAIENARLFSELRQRTGELSRSVDQLRALGEVGQAVSSTLDLDAVLQAIVTRAAQLASSRGVSIWEYDELTEVFHLRMTNVLDPEVAEILKVSSIRKGEGAIGRAALTRAPVQIPDVSLPGAYEGPLRAALLRAGGGSVLTLPLLHEDRILGGLTVSRRATGEFPPDLVSLLTAFAAQSAIALANARLFRELEAKSHELEVASRHKSQFLANMSHELRTPLNAILGYGELIVDGIYGEVPDRMREVLERVDASGRHLLGLINDVLDLSKIEAGQLVLTLAEYSMKEIVETVVASLDALAIEKGLILAVEMAPDLPTGRGDQRRLLQVLLNLVGNAIKFTEEGGVGVEVGVVGPAFEISVRDTGPGIAPADQERIFEEFQQADTSTTRPKGGTGLGLAIARRIVGLHGGRLWVESVPGEGATFRFSVPVRVDRQAPVFPSETL